VSVKYKPSTSGAVNNAMAIVLIEPAVPASVAPLAEYVTQACKTELGTYCSQVIPADYVRERTDRLPDRAWYPSDPLKSR
jgi:hypothetical protein